MSVNVLRGLLLEGSFTNWTPEVLQKLGVFTGRSRTFRSHFAHFKSLRHVVQVYNPQDTWFVCGHVTEEKVDVSQALGRRGRRPHSWRAPLHVATPASCAASLG